METRFHAAALGALGLVPDDLEHVVGQMFVRRRRDAVGYWLQLMLSMGIATMGLVLGSTAVVIGAMLIAPLMGPIVELGMALTIGSPALTVRSFVRVLGSVIAVVGGAAALTIALPFHEITPEIASRTLPTALDLIIAIFVALAAVFTTVRPSSETTSAAAGTAIGIALVPPVCVMGFGVGIGDAAVAGGATLLFLTNLTAILFISVVSFWLLGFERVNAAHWEEAALAEARPGGPLYRAMVKLHSLYQAPYGRVFRVSIPIVLVGSVMMPLGQALDQVAWEVRTRTLVSRLLDQTLAMHDAVQSRVTVQRREVGVHVYLVGTPEQANVLQDDLTNRIAAGSGVIPTVRVVAVPDVTTLQRQAPATERERTTVPPAERIDEVRMLVANTIQGVWPQDQLGPVLGWQLEVQDSALLRVRVRHWGEPAGAATEEVLGRMLSGRVGAPLRVATQALPDEPVSATAADGALWLTRLMRIIDAAITVPAVNVCVTLPGDRTLRDRTLSRVADVSRVELERVPEARRSIESQGTQWTVRLATGPCIPPQDG
jgi:uncharacterized hydrophobic protein (TIGR00271 family)